MIRPAKVRSIRAYLGETQEKFAKRFDKSRYDCIYWEKYGIMDQPDMERLMLTLEGPSSHDTPANPKPSG